MCIRNITGFFKLLLLMWINMFMAPLFFISTVCASTVTMKSEHSVHCSPPAGSVDGHIVVEDGGGGISDLTTLSWQVALGSTLCYRSAGDRVG